MKIWPKMGVCCLLALMAGQVRAEAFVYGTRGADLFSFDVPAGWEVLDGFEVPAGDMSGDAIPAPRIVSIRPPDEPQIMWTGFWSPVRLSDIRNSKGWMEEAIPRLLAEPENLYFDNRTVGGKPARFYSGEGVRDGRNFDYAVALIQITPGRVAVAAFIGEPEAYDRHEQDLIGVLQSISAEAM